MKRKILRLAPLFLLLFALIGTAYAKEGEKWWFINEDAPFQFADYNPCSGQVNTVIEGNASGWVHQFVANGVEHTQTILHEYRLTDDGFVGYGKWKQNFKAPVPVGFVDRHYIHRQTIEFTNGEGDRYINHYIYHLLIQAGEVKIDRFHFSGQCLTANSGNN